MGAIFIFNNEIESVPNQLLTKQLWVQNSTSDTWVGLQIRLALASIREVEVFDVDDRKRKDTLCLNFY